MIGHRAEGGGGACGVSTKAFGLIWRVAGSPLGTGSHGTTIDANAKNDTRRWNTCTPSRQLHPPFTGTRVGACDSTVPVCACGECGDELAFLHFRATLTPSTNPLSSTMSTASPPSPSPPSTPTLPPPHRPSCLSHRSPSFPHTPQAPSMPAPPSTDPGSSH
jgi:hypothetical protein